LESSIQTEQGLLAEVQALRKRVVELEEAVTRRQCEETAITRQLEALLEALPDGVFIYDRQGNIQRCNSTARTFFEDDHIPDYQHRAYADYIGNLEPRDMRGHPLPQEQWSLHRILRGEKLLGDNEAEGIIRLPDGTDRYFRASGVPLRDANEQIIGAILIVRDISMQHMLEQRERELLQEAERRASELEAVFETLADGIVIYDQQKRIIRMNAAFRILIGLNEENTTQYASLSYDEQNALLNMRCESSNTLLQQMQLRTHFPNGEPGTEKYPLEATIHALNGRDLTVSISETPIRDSQGNITGTVAVFRDVTDQRALERRKQAAIDELLAMAEILVQGAGDESAENADESARTIMSHIVQRLRRVMACARVGIVAIEPETEHVHTIAMAGTTSQEKQYWREHLDGTPLQEHIQDTATLGSLRTGQPVIVTINQRYAPYIGRQTLLVPIHIRGRLSAILTVDYSDGQHDYTPAEITLAQTASRFIAMVIEREQLLRARAEAHANELALLEANRRMDEFLGIISHELKNPLTAINGNIQLAKRCLNALPTENHTPESLLERYDLIYEMLSRAERQIRIQNRLVNDLLDVSRIQTQRLTLHMQPYDLLTLVHETVEDMRTSVPARTITLEAMETTALPVFIDRDRIGQVLMNFLTNALKYSESHCPVLAQCSIEGDMARVAVHDKGPGIPLDEQERIWQRFYQVPGMQVKSGSGVGLGLGLYICHAIIKHHGGQIGVQSQPGVGSTFWFLLPLYRT
jgi:signal transduction histidine kinase/PAS domain-containing protein